MLSEKKRFNYMVGTQHYGSAHKKNQSTYLKTHIQPQFDTHSHEDKENNKKVEELENINKRLVEETARQFKKLEDDVQRVEAILQEKEEAVQQLKEQNAFSRQEVEKANEEKKILIEAIFEKDLVIREYEQRLKDLLEQQTHQDISTPQKSTFVPLTEEIGCQTAPIESTVPREEFIASQSRNLQLEDEVFRLKEELFEATSKVKVLSQQFQAYKILKQIESLQEG